MAHSESDVSEFDEKGTEDLSQVCESSQTATTSGSTVSTTSAKSIYEQSWPPIVIEAPVWGHGMKETKGDSISNFRLLHWGPLIALFIIGFISAVTTHFIMMWWPFNTPAGLVHFLVFMFWNYLTLSNMLSASFIGAGYVPFNWSPPNDEHSRQLQFCKPCKGYKAPRSHHCSKCKRCVMKMDHHCPWINNCVGHRNHGYFVRFLLFAIVGCVHAVIIHIICAYHVINQMWYIRYGNGTEPVIFVTFWSLISLIGASAFAFGVAVGLAGLLFFQIKGIWKNRTGIEDYIDQKALSRQEEDDTVCGQWIYPYDLGWKRNLKEILLYSLSGRTKGNGIWWPVCEPCDQFTFTREQLAQKEVKRRMARLVRIKENFSGGIFGSLRFGCKIFCCQPISEEERIKVFEDERWVITQATKYWFYGHKQDIEDAPKGWFPRQVAELLEDRPY